MIENVRSFDGQPRPAAPMPFLEFRPEGEPPAAGWPLLVFLHGAGEKGSDVDRVRAAPVPRALAAGLTPPCVIACPQCPVGPGWPIATLTALFDELTADPAIDGTRVGLTGISMGGRGAWELAYWRADRLSAIAPVCGFGIPNLAPLFARVPIWAFHGEDDDVLPLARSREMVAGVRAAGGDARLTVMPGIGHDCGESVYGDPTLWSWLLAQRLPEPGQEITE